MTVVNPRTGKRVRLANSQRLFARDRESVEEAFAGDVVGIVGNLDLPAGMRIGAILRDGEVITPSGSVKIRPKDRVVIFVLDSAVKQVEQLFRVSLEFF